MATLLPYPEGEEISEHIGEEISEGELAGWRKGSFTAKGYTRETYRRSPPAATTITTTMTGGAASSAPPPPPRRPGPPGVIIIHEIPGIYCEVIEFANEVVAAGFEVIMPSLLGTPGQAVTPWYVASSLYKLCISKEFTVWALNKTSPIIVYLRAMAKHMHGQCGGPGVGVVGMCFSGGFALGMMVGGHVAAPVVSQPSLPFAFCKAQAADLNLSIEDLGKLEACAKGGCPVKGYMYENDWLVGTRFDTLSKLLGGNFCGRRFEGSKHSVLATDRVCEAVRDVLEFFKERLMVNGDGKGNDGGAHGEEEGSSST